jgi:hypothetical protein
MTLYKLEIPIPDYDKDNIFMQPLYFEGMHEPTREEVIDLLHDLNDEHRDSSEYDGLWMDCLLSIDSTEEFPDTKTPFVQCETTNSLRGFLTLSTPIINRLYNA